MKLLFENKKLENNISNIDNVKEWAKPLKKNLTKIIKYLKSVNSFKEMFIEKKILKTIVLLIINLVFIMTIKNFLKNFNKL